MKRIHCFGTFLLSVSILLGCSKTDNPITPVIPPKVVVQYGVPFANVPDPRDVSMYQVNMRAFSSGGNLQGVTNRLDQIKALGVNVIYLMPVYPVGVKNSVNSPYCVKDYMNVGSEFGALTDLQNLVAEAHTRGMAVILDWVANHTSWDNAWIATKSWYQQDLSGNIIAPPGTGWTDVAQLNYNNYDMRTAMIKAMKYWVLAANIDGYRCDAADNVPVDFWKQAIDTLRNIKTHHLLMMAEGTRSGNYAAGFDFNFGFAYYTAIKGIFGLNKAVTTLDAVNTSDYLGASTSSRIIKYLTNHDVNGSDDVPQNLFGGFKGAMATFVTVAYMNDVPMIYNGQEVGTPNKIVFPFTGYTIDWTINPAITAEYSAILKVRNEHDAIRRGTLTSYNSADVCAFEKESDTEKIVVFSNLRNKSIAFTTPAALVGTVWKDAFSGNAITLGSEVQLDAFAYLVLKNN